MLDEQNEDVWISQSRMIAVALALCGCLVCTGCPGQVDAVWAPLLGPCSTDNSRHLQKRWHEWMANKARLAGLILECVAALFYLSQGDCETTIFPMTWFTVVYFSPPTQECGLFYQWVSGCVMLPARGLLGAIGAMHMPSTIPTAVLCPMIGAMLHDSVANHLAVSFFVSAAIACFANTPFEFSVSALGLLLSTFVVVIKCAWFRREAHKQSQQSSKDTTITTATKNTTITTLALRSINHDLVLSGLIAAPLVMCLIMLRLYQAYPGARTHLYSEPSTLLLVTHRID